jgi:hypothetical protein
MDNTGDTSWPPRNAPGPGSHPAGWGGTGSAPEGSFWAAPGPAHDPERETEVLESSAAAGLDDGAGTGPDAGEPHAGGGRRRRRWLIVGSGVLALALVAGGATVAVTQLRGGGAQPERFIPANALAMVKVDLDPSAGQKLGALRFFRHFPDTHDSQDLREEIFFELAKDLKGLTGVSFDKEVKPWLGNRAALAVLPAARASDEPDVEAVLQVKDEDKARNGLSRLVDRSIGAAGGAAGFVVRDGYAIIADDQARADRFAAASRRSALGSRPGFKADMRGLDDGVAATWTDIRGVIRMAASQRSSTSAEAQRWYRARARAYTTLRDQFATDARFVAGVRFEGGRLEARGRLTGLAKDVARPARPASPVTRLPESTVVAFGMRGMDVYARQLWSGLDQVVDTRNQARRGPSLDEVAGSLGDRYGFQLPADLRTLFGRSLAVALGPDGLDIGEPQVGARSVTNPAKADKILDKVQRFLDDVEPGGATFAYRRARDGVVVASSEDYADELARDGRLGRSPAFRAALPDADRADTVLWVDVDTLAAKLGDKIDDADDRESLSHVDAVGLTAGQRTKGTWEFRLRVLAR